MNKKIMSSSALLAVLLTASACQKKAEGQVVAVVNGEEITLNELNAEIAEMNLPANADKQAARAQILQKMIDRRLLAQAAKEAGIDRDPTYISQERRMDEQLLVSMYGKKAMDTVPVPGNAEVDKFIAEHPAMFADRTRYALNQLQFDMPADANRLKELESANSIEDVATRLTAMGIKFEQGKGALDSAVVPEQIISRINSLPAGEPFIVPQGNKVVVSVVTGTEKVALPPERARPIAAQALRAQSLNKIGEDRLKEAKAKAKIEYQAGYEAPKADTKGSPAKS
ncbi:EpsD family peptidyl-prolyl cis-trans isomerase [Sphingobium sp. CR28]|uniref:EpsD family peptidyl-prolyl cis-trans isomerase n=1 Tax=Sphingobium sp. CR28 TaxID=3400272 RepID=UPI003FF09225